MKIIIKKRGGGKTTEVFKMALEEGAYPVLRNREHAVRAFRANAERNHITLFPMTHDDLLSGKYRGMPLRKVVIDDYDDLARRAPATWDGSPHSLCPGVEVIGIAYTSLYNQREEATMLTPAEIQERFRKRKQEANQKEVRLWVHVDAIEEVKDFVHKQNEKHKQSY